MADAVPNKWTTDKIPTQKGKKVVITGANSGIGFVTALELARHGADVVLACRSESKGQEAVTNIQNELKGTTNAGHVEARKLDVSSLESVKAFADGIRLTHDRIDILINNAGIMAVPYAETVDGIESQFATNHLGHFALVGRVLDLLKASHYARIVSVSSLLHQDAKVDVNAVVTSQKNYDPMAVYANSKAYNLLFTFELNRRFQQNGIANVVATAAHPGVTATNLAATMLDNFGFFKRLLFKIIFMMPFIQTPEFGALPTLYASTATNVKPGDYFGPRSLGGVCGYPTKEEPDVGATSMENARALWLESERLTGFTFAF